MTRYKLTIEYHGGGFSGWQRQANAPSVQQAIEEAITRYCAETVTVHGAGRTDAGVHARAQVAHIDLAKDTNSDEIRDALNFHLREEPATILSVEEVDAEFHARFSAVQRAYEYRIINRKAPLAIEKGLAYWLPQPLDADAMHEAAQALPGKHDFTTFRAANCQADSPVKTLDAISVHREEDRVYVRVRARSFLYQQVRILVGTLKMVGEGKWTAEDVAHALAAKDRARGGPTAPPEGLYLTEVVY
ncbi:MAG: tRNA pseudouridine(38-40) synthase TruA [Proteobacteria bacterium]|nr:tRNA pseudouridine(38-40) synthase TruA [Pseudomonadota bacterium]